MWKHHRPWRLDNCGLRCGIILLRDRNQHRRHHTAERDASAAGQKSEERIETAKRIWEILIDQQYGIGTVGQSPALMGVRLVSNKLGNIPSRNCIAQHCRTP